MSELIFAFPYFAASGSPLPAPGNTKMQNFHFNFNILLPKNSCVNLFHFN